jgi:hypothetical protein
MTVRKTPFPKIDKITEDIKAQNHNISGLSSLGVETKTRYKGAPGISGKNWRAGEKPFHVLDKWVVDKAEEEEYDAPPAPIVNHEETDDGKFTDHQEGGDDWGFWGKYNDWTDPDNPTGWVTQWVSGAPPLPTDYWKRCIAYLEANMPHWSFPAEWDPSIDDFWPFPIEAQEWDHIPDFSFEELDSQSAYGSCSAIEHVDGIVVKDAEPVEDDGDFTEETHENVLDLNGGMEQTYSNWNDWTDEIAVGASIIISHGITGRNFVKRMTNNQDGETGPKSYIELESPITGVCWFSAWISRSNHTNRESNVIRAYDSEGIELFTFDQTGYPTFKLITAAKTVSETGTVSLTGGKNWYGELSESFQLSYDGGVSKTITLTSTCGDLAAVVSHIQAAVDVQFPSSEFTVSASTNYVKIEVAQGHSMELDTKYPISGSAIPTIGWALTDDLDITYNAGEWVHVMFKLDFSEPNVPKVSLKINNEWKAQNCDCFNSSSSDIQKISLEIPTDMGSSTDVGLAYFDSVILPTQGNTESVALANRISQGGDPETFAPNYDDNFYRAYLHFPPTREGTATCLIKVDFTDQDCYIELRGQGAGQDMIGPALYLKAPIHSNRMAYDKYYELVVIEKEAGSWDSVYTETGYKINSNEWTRISIKFRCLDPKINDEFTGDPRNPYNVRYDLFVGDEFVGTYNFAVEGGNPAYLDIFMVASHHTKYADSHFYVDGVGISGKGVFKVATGDDQYLEYQGIGTEFEEGRNIGSGVLGTNSLIVDNKTLLKGDTRILGNVDVAQDVNGNNLLAPTTNDYKKDLVVFDRNWVAGTDDIPFWTTYNATIEAEINDHQNVVRLESLAAPDSEGDPPLSPLNPPHSIADLGFMARTWGTASGVGKSQVRGFLSCWMRFPDQRGDLSSYLRFKLRDDEHIECLYTDPDDVRYNKNPDINYWGYIDSMAVEIILKSNPDGENLVLRSDMDDPVRDAKYYGQEEIGRGNPNQWVHVAVAWDCEICKFKIWLNREYIGQFTFANPLHQIDTIVFYVGGNPYSYGVTGESYNSGSENNYSGVAYIDAIITSFNGATEDQMFNNYFGFLKGDKIEVNTIESEDISTKIMKIDAKGDFGVDDAIFNFNANDIIDDCLPDATENGISISIDKELLGELHNFCISDQSGTYYAQFYTNKIKLGLGSYFSFRVASSDTGLNSILNLFATNDVDGDTDPKISIQLLSDLIQQKKNAAGWDSLYGIQDDIFYHIAIYIDSISAVTYWINGVKSGTYTIENNFDETDSFIDKIQFSTVAGSSGYETYYNSVYVGNSKQKAFYSLIDGIVACKGVLADGFLMCKGILINEVPIDDHVKSVVDSLNYRWTFREPEGDTYSFLAVANNQGGATGWAYGHLGLLYQSVSATNNLNICFTIPRLWKDYTTITLTSVWGNYVDTTQRTYTQAIVRGASWQITTDQGLGGEKTLTTVVTTTVPQGAIQLYFTSPVVSFYIGIKRIMITFS